jgi:hypothetical protein
MILLWPHIHYDFKENYIADGDVGMGQVKLYKVKVKVNLSLYKPAQALSAPGSRGSQDFWTVGT